MKKLTAIIILIFFGLLSCEDNHNNKKNILPNKVSYIEKEYEFGWSGSMPRNIEFFKNNYSFCLVDDNLTGISRKFILLSEDGDTLFCKDPYIWEELNSDFEIMPDSSIVVARKYVYPSDNYVTTYNHIYKFDKNWQLLWDKIIQRNSAPGAKPKISITNDEEILVASGMSLKKVSIIKLDNQSNIIWEKIIEISWEYLKDFRKNKKGEYFLEIITKDTLINGRRIITETKTYQIDAETGNYNFIQEKKLTDEILINKRLGTSQIIIKKDSVKKQVTLIFHDLKNNNKNEEILFENYNNIIISDVYNSKYNIFLLLVV